MLTRLSVMENTTKEHWEWTLLSWEECILVPFSGDWFFSFCKTFVYLHIIRDSTAELKIFGATTEIQSNSVSYFHNWYICKILLIHDDVKLLYSLSRTGYHGSSAGKESSCGRPQFYPWVEKIPWRRDRLPTPVFLGFPGGSDREESACNAEDLGLIPWFGRTPGEGNGNPLQYSCLENLHGHRSLVG